MKPEQQIAMIRRRRKLHQRGNDRSGLHCLARILVSASLALQLAPTVHAFFTAWSNNRDDILPSRRHRPVDSLYWRKGIPLISSAAPPSCLSRHSPREYPSLSSSSLSSETNSGEADVNTETNTSSNSTTMSEVFYETIWLPLPKRGDADNQEAAPDVSLVRWEEVVLARPINGAVLELPPRNPLKDLSIVTLTSVGMVLCFGLLVSASGPGAWRYYLAGGLCAAISHSIPVPIDVVKTRKQVDPSLANKDFVAAMRYMVQHEGLPSLWAGLGPTTLGYLIEGSIKFGVYEATKPFIRKMLLGLSGLSSYLTFLNSHVLALILSGAASGFAAAVVLCPMEALRIRLVAQKETKLNFLKAGFQMIKKEGVISMTRGIVPMLCKQIPYTITKNVSFDLSTRAAYAFLRAQALAVSSANKILIPVLAGALASILSCYSSQPGDMLLSLMNAYEGERRRTQDIIRDILRSDRGIGGFMVGIKTRLLHVGVIVTLQLFIYDILKQVCGIAATGSV